MRWVIAFALLLLVARGDNSNDDSTTLDYLIQDICVDSHGNLVNGGEPYECPALSRDLLPGEALPYHKHDFKGSPGKIYQLSNAFPVWHKDGTIRVVHTLDFDPSHNVSYLEFVPNVDGFNANQASTEFASIVGTADPSGGVQYFVASDGQGGCTTLDSWGLWKKSLFTRNKSSTSNRGSHLFNLNIMRDVPPSPGHCPDSYNAAFTTYELFPSLRYDSGKTLESLVQQHWAGTSMENAGSAEKEFFTREYGLTRWEAWRKKNGKWVQVDYRDWSFTKQDPDGGYIPFRYPVVSELLAGANRLDNGDFGRGQKNVGNWSRSGPGGWMVNLEATGNHYLTSTGKSNESCVSQDIEVESEWMKPGCALAFGAQLWQAASGESASAESIVTLSLAQLTANGMVLSRTSVNGTLDLGRRQFRGTDRLLANASILQFAVTAGFSRIEQGHLVTSWSMDNAWLVHLPERRLPETHFPDGQQLQAETTHSHSHSNNGREEQASDGGVSFLVV